MGVNQSVILFPQVIFLINLSDFVGTIISQQSHLNRTKDSLKKFSISLKLQRISERAYWFNLKRDILLLDNNDTCWCPSTINEARNTIKVNQRYVSLSQGPAQRLHSMGLPRPAWERLNHLRNGVGRFQSSMHERVLALTSICECGGLDQNATHVILECSLHRAPRGYHGLLILDDEIRYWLNNIVANI